MKKYIITISFIFLFLLAFGQKSNGIKNVKIDSLSKIEINLIGKWKLDSSQYDEMNPKFNKKTNEFEGTKGKTIKRKVVEFLIYEFFDNNKYKYEYNNYNGPDGKYKDNGEWKYENGKLYLRSNKNKLWSGGYTIDKITSEKCVLSVDVGLEGGHLVDYYIRVK